MSPPFIEAPAAFRIFALRRWVCTLLALLFQVTAMAGSDPSVLQKPFFFRDENGKAAALSQWQGRQVLLTMAYSTCREVCSYTLHRLEELQDSADRAGVPIEVVVVSLDPQVDGPQSWSVYRQHHHLKRSNWHFLTGDAAATEAFAAAFDFRFWRYDEHVVHDFRILDIAPDGAIAKTLVWETRDLDLFAESR